jgi:hypothetical protein
MKLKETTRTFVTKSGDTWEWVETQEFVKSLQEYWNIVNSNKQVG